MKRFLLIFSLFSLPLTAADPVGQDELKKPILSATGRQRLEENIRLLEIALRDLRDNLSASDKNVATLAAELKDLGQLEREHLALKKKYQGYLAQDRKSVV